MESLHKLRAGEIAHAAQERGPEFRPLNYPKTKPDLVLCPYNSSAMEAETSRSLKFTGQPVEPSR